MDDLTNEQPEIEPTLFSYRELPTSQTEFNAAYDEMAKALRSAGAQWLRVTLISPEFEKPPYPHGLYMEGWVEIPQREAPFNYPLTA